jgi:hypothetical protein
MVRRYCMYVRPAWNKHVSASAAVVACPVRNIDRRVTFRCMHHPQSIMDRSNVTWFLFFKGWIISLCIVLCCLCQVEWFPTARRSMSRKEIANEATEDATARPTGNTTMYVYMYVGVDVYQFSILVAVSVRGSKLCYSRLLFSSWRMHCIIILGRVTHIVHMYVLIYPQLSASSNSRYPPVQRLPFHACIVCMYVWKGYLFELLSV